MNKKAGKIVKASGAGLRRTTECGEGFFSNVPDPRSNAQPPHRGPDPRGGPRPHAGNSGQAGRGQRNPRDPRSGARPLPSANTPPPRPAAVVAPRPAPVAAVVAAAGVPHGSREGGWLPDLVYT
ncbi:MAG: hypothetical protein ACKOTF_09515, partial [Opitutaceae bacterium]